jgi:dolichyl-phosphate-mannose--protein O-mannosyl transferase
MGKTKLPLKLRLMILASLLSLLGWVINLLPFYFMDRDYSAVAQFIMGSVFFAVFLFSAFMSLRLRAREKAKHARSAATMRTESDVS